MKRCIWMMGLVLGLVTLNTGCAHRSKPLQSIEGDQVELSVKTHAYPLPIFYHNKDFYLLGEMGRPYEICIINRADKRIEAVVAVDGRDTVSGRVADYRTDRGYVIEPNEETCIDGFRSSMNTVAAFEFTTESNAYSSRMGTEQFVGVIGVAVFPESRQTRNVIAVPASPMDRSVSKTMDSSPAMAEEAEQMGTQYGSQTASQAEAVIFTRESNTPIELISLYYDGREGLEKRGIRIPDDLEFAPKEPNPFPGARDGRFAPPPPQH